MQKLRSPGKQAGLEPLKNLKDRPMSPRKAGSQKKHPAAPRRLLITVGKQKALQSSLPAALMAPKEANASSFVSLAKRGAPASHELGARFSKMGRALVALSLKPQQCVRNACMQGRCARLADASGLFSIMP